MRSNIPLPESGSISAPKIAVLIVNYNSKAYLKRALAALSEQSLLPDEVIVLDNASKEVLDRAEFPDNLQLKLIHSSENMGFAAGNNRAAKAVSSDINWLFLLNPDAYPEKNCLQQLVLAIKKHPEFSFFGCKLISDKDQRILDGTGDAYHISGKAWRMNHQKPDKLAIQESNPKKHQSKEAQEVCEIFSPCAAAAIYRRDIFEKVQGFDERFFCYYEDIDMSFRLRLLGLRAAYVPSAIAAHTGSATTTRHSDFYTYHGHRNLVWTYAKNMPTCLLILSLPLHILLNLVSMVLFIKRKQGKVILKAKWDALRGLKIIMKQRQALQKQRQISSRGLLKVLHKGLPW